ncbi:MAG: gluconate 2-dehydrogenase subunit 3 family protein [Rhizobiaceae bacterium]
MHFSLKRPQRTNPLAHRVDRRLFLKTTSITAALGIGAATAGVSGALAAQSLPAEASATLLRMAKDIYPHDELIPDQPYQAVVDAILEEAKKDPTVATLCVDGLKDVNARTKELYGKAYLDVPTEDERVAVLRAIEYSPFFQKLRGGLLFGIYNNKELWPKFGYEGSSWEEGGYIDRGFNDLNWL